MFITSICLAQVITGFSPDIIAAGKGDILTINGTGFGKKGPTSTQYVSFSGASVGVPIVKPQTNDYVLWTDTQILVKVPTDAGTGLIKVINGTTATSTTSLVINYDLINVIYNNNAFIPLLVNSNKAGGYTLQMNYNFNNNTAASQTFVRAVNTWKCSTNVNWSFGAITNVNTVANDGVNVIRFENTGELDAGLLGQTHSYYTSGDSKRWEVIGSDIVFANSVAYNWNFGAAIPGPFQYDFLTTALHELGHVQQLGHVNNFFDIMNATTPAGTRRSLYSDDITAGNYIMSLSTASATVFISPPMLAATSCNVPLSPDANLNSLTLSNGILSPAFTGSNTTYKVSVSNIVSSITVVPTTDDPNATQKVNGIVVKSGTASPDIPLTLGTNVISVVVTAQDGIATNTYKITVTRQKSSNADLTNLALSSGTLTPAFTPSVTAYTASVDYLVPSITVTPTVSDSTATLKVNGTTLASGLASAAIPLNIGYNSIAIVVTAQDGSTKTYNINVSRTIPDIYSLPQNNFNLTIASATCKGSNNGSINIIASQSANYTATITGNSLNMSYPFTNSQNITNLAPGAYAVCISITGQPDYQQCFDEVITEPADLSVYSTVNSSNNTVNLVLTGGTRYNLFLNGTNYTTTDSSITLPLKYGNNALKVTTDRLCQGTIERIIYIEPNIIAYPDPFQNTLNINLGVQNTNNLKVTINSMSDGKLVFSGQYVNKTGILQLDLSSLNTGIYALHVTIENSEKVFKIMKQ